MSIAKCDNSRAARLDAQLRLEEWGDAAGDCEKLNQQRRVAIATDLDPFVGVKKKLTDG